MAKFDLKDFLRERDEALYSFDKAKIDTYIEKYHVHLPRAIGATLEIPAERAIYWGSVCKSILSITNAPDSAKGPAKAILDLLGWSYEFT